MFDFEGKTYQFPVEVNYAAEEAFCQWLALESLRAVEAQQEHVGPDIYAFLLRGWREDGAAQAYEFDSLASRRALGSVRGLQQLALILLRQANPGKGAPTLDLVRRARKDPAAWGRLQLLTLTALDPNGRWPGTLKAGPASPTTSRPASKSAATGAGSTDDSADVTSPGSSAGQEDSTASSFSPARANSPSTT